MTSDLDDRLGDLRGPVDWSPRERAAVLDHVLAADATPQGRDGRFVAPHPRRRVGPPASGPAEVPPAGFEPATPGLGVRRSIP